MSEELLKAILQLLAIVVRERITDAERNNIKEFLLLHLNRDTTNYYLKLFDQYVKEGHHETRVDLESVDVETQQFVDDWATIMKIVRQVNQALTRQQKMVLIVKIIELVSLDNEISDSQANLIFYIGQALKISQEDVHTLQTFVTGYDIDELANPNVLIIDEGSGDYAGPRLIEKDLTGLIAILRLLDGEIYFIKYLGITTLYLNSILLRSRRIDIFPTGSTIRGDKVGPIYYSDIIGKFLRDDEKSKITFSADHIFYHFPSGRAGIQNVNIYERGGRLIGIMGASGSGKSTLLNVLNGTEKPSSGRVVINGVDIHQSAEEVQGIIGYVPQDDLLIEDLTVFENLYYAAKLSFGKHSEREIIDVVMRTLVNLGLSEIRELKVGSVMNKTISGGQRKRLNIALELLREPAILFVDEPTSGLSSRDSENIMDLLKELSLRGKMVFVVIHQPSSDIFKMFDTLVIMDVGGFQIYYGNPIEAVSYFRDIVNAANKTSGACPECGNINPEQIFSIIETKVVNEYGRLTSVRKISAGQWYQYFKQKIRVKRQEHSQESLPAVHTNSNWINQFRTYFVRDVLAKVANKQYLWMILLEAPVLAFFIAFMVKYYNVLTDGSYSFHSNSNVPVYFFMCVVVALFLGLIVSAEEIFRDKKIRKREQFLNLSASSYLLSKVSVMFIISAVQTFLLMIVGNLILEIPLTEMRYWFILFSVSCFANVLGLNISSGFNSAVTIYILIPVLVIPQLLLSGVVINFDRFNPAVGKPVGIPLMGEIMTSRWAFEAFMVTQFKDNPYEKKFYELDQTIAMADYKRVYYIPQLESRLAYCINHPQGWNNPNDTRMTETFKLLQHELKNELRLTGGDKLPEVEQIGTGQFDSLVYRKSMHYLSVLKRAYARQMDEAVRKREKLIAYYTSTPEEEKNFERFRKRYVNEAVTDAVKNISAAERIVEYDGSLIQKIYPIYQLEHQPRHLFDFTANLYQPTKHFMGRYVDTLVFNIAVIWTMTVILFITLYLDLIRKIMNRWEGQVKHRRKQQA